MPMRATADEIEQMIKSGLAGIPDAERITKVHVLPMGSTGWYIKPVVDGLLMHAPLGALQNIVMRLQAEVPLVK